jgi:hypothetical protein
MAPRLYRSGITGVIAVKRGPAEFVLQRAPADAGSIIFFIFIQDDLRSVWPATDSIPG